MRTALTAFLLLAAVLVSGCSDETVPSTVKTRKASASSSPAVTPTASPVTSPEEQIEAMMQEYFVSANEMFRSGQVAELRSYSVPRCPCRKITRYAERIYMAGGQFRGAEYENIRLRVHDIEGDTAVVEATASVSAYKVINSNGEVVEDSPGGELHTDYSVVRVDGERWIIGNAVDLG